MTRIDPHLHTRFSGDAIISPKLIVEQLYAHPFIKAVAITDHNTMQGYIEVRKLASSYQDITIIPGVEVSTHHGDIIILGVEEKPSYASTVWEVVDFAKARAGVIVIPHPYRINGIGDLAEKDTRRRDRSHKSHSNPKREQDGTRISQNEKPARHRWKRRTCTSGYVDCIYRGERRSGHR